MPNPVDQRLEQDDFQEEETQLERFGLNFELTRRRFMVAAGTITAGVAAGLPGIAFAESAEAVPTQTVALKINGKSQSLMLDPRTSLSRRFQHPGKVGLPA